MGERDVFRRMPSCTCCACLCSRPIARVSLQFFLHSRAHPQFIPPVCVYSTQSAQSTPHYFTFVIHAPASAVATSGSSANRPRAVAPELTDMRNSIAIHFLPPKTIGGPVPFAGSSVVWMITQWHMALERLLSCCGCMARS